MHLILFIVFAVLCLTGAINLLLQTHPINSALSLIVVMTSLAVLYLLLGAEFLAAAQVIVYAGAIMVLFTFVVMLLNAGREERTLGSRAARTVGFPAVVAILAVIATTILRVQGLGTAGMQDHITSTADLSAVLFTKLLLPFEVTSVLILIAILGWSLWPAMATEKGRTAIEFNPPYRSTGNPSYLVSALERCAVLPWNCRLPYQAQSDHDVYVDRVDAQRRQSLVCHFRSPVA